MIYIMFSKPFTVYVVSSPDSAVVLRVGVGGEGGEGKRKIEE